MAKDKRRGFSTTARVVVPLLFSGLLLPAPNPAWAQDSTAPIEPTIRLEKPKYVVGESVRFWVGVQSTNSLAIPQELRRDDLCRLLITRPDGTIEKEPLGWPKDDLLESRGWFGGESLGDKVEAGTYVLTVQCANQTKRLELIVEDNEISSQIKTTFRFEQSGPIRMGTSVPVILAVENDSQHTIRFPQRGAMGEGVSIQVTRKEPAFRYDFFYPWEKLSHSAISPLTYTWDSVADIPSVVLKPGEHFEQRFLLEDAYPFDRPGSYNVGFSTVLPVLVGEKGGPFADFCPIRFEVDAAEQFVVTEAR
jgi:hypothetical protein